MSKMNKPNRNIGGTWASSCAALLVMLPLPTSATVCWADYMINEQENPTEFLQSISEVIFIGKAVAKSTEVFEDITQPGIKKIVAEKTSFEIESVTKGDLVPGKNVLIEGIPGDCSCIGNFDLGGKYLVYAIVDDRTGKIMLRYCNFGKKIE